MIWLQIIIPAPTIYYYEVRCENIFFIHVLTSINGSKVLVEPHKKMVADKIIDKGAKQFYVA